MEFSSLFFSAAALIISAVSFYFSIKSWRESNRPLITARIATHSGGNVGSTLDLIIENTGNRPAKNIGLAVDPDKLNVALLLESNEPMRKQIEKCFSERGVIPVLVNGRSTSNGFGFLAREGPADWVRHSRFNISISYEDLDGRNYKHEIPLLIADDQGFAGGFWSPPS
jgi:hypothetical protein